MTAQDKEATSLWVLWLSRNVRARHSLEVSYLPLLVPVRAGPRTGKEKGDFPKFHPEIRTDPHNSPSHGHPVTNVTLG